MTTKYIYTSFMFLVEQSINHCITFNDILFQVLISTHIMIVYIRMRLCIINCTVTLVCLRLLQQREKHHIELQQMLRVRWHEENNKILLVAQFVELERLVALVTVDNKQSVWAYTTRLCMRVEVLQPCDSNLIIRPAVRTNLKNPIESCLIVPGGYEHLASKDDEGRNCPPRCIDSLDHCSPLAFAWLSSLWSATLLRACEDHLNLNLAHHEARLIKVVRLHPGCRISP